MEYHLFNDIISEDFFTIFDEPEIVFNVMTNVEQAKDLEKLITEEQAIKDISKYLETSNLSFFSYFNKNPELIYKMYAELAKQNNDYFVIARLAPILGLPTIKDDMEELKELKELLIWVKDKFLEHSKMNIRLILTRDDEYSGIKLTSTNEKLEKELNEEFLNKISSSPVLSQWYENQVISLKNKERKIDSLLVYLPLSKLLNEDEKEQYYRDSPQFHIGKNRIRKIR